MPVKTINLTFNFTHVPPVMRRGTHALAVLTDRLGNYLLGGKHIYPPGIYRLIGGGVNTNETSEQGMLRELLEETGFQANPASIQELVQIDAQLTDRLNRRFQFRLHLFCLKTDPKQLKPLSDLDDIKSFSPTALKKLIRKYQSLPTDLVHLSKVPDTEFRWSDYGQFFSKIHQLALDLTTTKPKAQKRSK